MLAFILICGFKLVFYFVFV